MFNGSVCQGDVEGLGRKKQPLMKKKMKNAFFLKKKVYLCGIKNISLMRRFYFYFISLFTVLGLVKVSGQTIDYTLPATVDVCGTPQTFEVTIHNNTTNVLLNVQFTAQLPTGLQYVPGSVSAPVSELNITKLDTPVFAVPNLAPTDSVTFTFQAEGHCALKTFIEDPNNDVLNVYILNYDGGSVTQTTFTYNVNTPALIYNSITNQTYTGNVGDVFVRTFYIKNSGSSGLDGFTFTDNCGTGLQLLGANNGNVVTQTSDFIELSFDASHFATIGNNDNIFDPGEIIIIEDTVKILSCNDLQSEFHLYWGCYGDTCEDVIETGGVTIANNIPNLDITTSINNSTCYGDPPVHDGTPSVANMTITNNGTGDAYNVVIDIRQCHSYTYPTFYPTTFRSRFDSSSVEISYDGGTTWQKISPDSVQNKNYYSCFSDPNPIGRMWFTIDTLPQGASVMLRFNMYHCCGDNCYQAYIFRGWCYQVNYENACRNNYFTEGTGTSYHSLWQRNVTFQYPTDVFDGDNFDACFSYQQWTLWQPYDNASAFWEIIVEIPSCFTYNSHTLTDADGTPWPSPDDMFWNGDSLILRYKTSSRPGGFAYWRWPTLCLNLTANCGGSCSGGVQGFNTTVYLHTDTTCTNGGCRMCQSNNQGGMQINVHCPNAPCPEGIDWKNYRHYRISYGLPDNNDDGLPDGTGSLDFTRVRRDRAMFTDTVRSWFSGVVRTDGTPSDWQYVFAVDTFTRYGYVFGDIMDTLEIFDASTGNTYVCTGIPRTMSNSGTGATYRRIYTWQMDANALAASGCVPPGFRFEDGDSISFRVYYEIDNNLGGRIEAVPIRPEFFATNVASPTVTDKFACDFFRGNIFVIGYYHTRWPPRLLEFYSCDSLLLQYWYYLSIGPCCNNYSGGNLFPYEYRQWSFLDTMRLTLPTGYAYVSGSARIRERRTAGSGNTAVSAWINLNPVSVSGNTYTFATNQQYDVNGGPASLSDDGYNGAIELRIRPSCQVEPEQEDTINAVFEFGGRLAQTINSGSHLRTVYYAPRLELSSPNSDVVIYKDTVEWIVNLNNIASNSDAHYSWLSFVSPSGNITVEAVYDTVPNPDTLVSDNGGGIYPIGNVNRGDERRFRILATLTGCAEDTLFVYAGWDCGGYPGTLADGCIKAIDTLVVIPQEADVLPSLTLSKDTINICDTVDVEIDLTNIKNGHGYNLYLFVGFPTGMNIIPGTQEYEYYAGSGWNALPNPGALGSYRFWYFPPIDAKLAGEGLVGAYDPAKNIVKVRFRVATDCNYISGGTIKVYSFFSHPCGTFDYNLAYSDVVAVAGAVNPYTAIFAPVRDTVRSCFDTVTVRIHWTNLGPGITTASDTMIMDVPNPITYVANSTDSVYRFPEVEPQIQNVGTFQRLKWGIPAGIAVGDSLVFTYQVAIPPSATAGTKIINAYSVINRILPCGTTTCNTFVSTGSRSLEIVVIRNQGLWTGEIDTDWFNPNNWGDCQLPNCNVDVIIPDVVNQPVINTAGTASTRDITIETNSSLTLTDNARLDVCGDVLVKPSATTIAGAGSELHFTGNINQLYTHNGNGADAWKNVFIEQTVNGRRVILNTDLIATESLTLTRGIIDGFSNNRLTIVRNPAVASVNTGNANSYVHGILRRTMGGAGTYYLPVGHLARGYELAELIFSSTTNIDSLDARFTPWTAPPTPPTWTECGASYGTLPNLNHGFWTISPITTSGAIPTYNILLHNVGYTNAVGAAYTVVNRPPAAWAFVGNCDPANSTAPLTGRLNLPSFGDFSIAQSSTPLPISLKLQAQPDYSVQSIYLSWNALQDIELAKYVLKRKTDNQTWKELKALPSNIFSYEDKNLTQGKTYFYQIEGISVSGNKISSNVVEVNFSESASFDVELLPNPFKEELVLKLSGFDADEFVDIKLYSVLGQELESHHLQASEFIHLRFDRVAAGTYLLEVTHLGEIRRMKIVKQ